MRREPLVPRVPIYHVALIRDRNATVPSAVVAKPADAAAVFCNAAGLILGHVHPSGDLTPGRDDIRLTKRLADAT
jgi:DNA repair protein RadC